MNCTYKYKGAVVTDKELADIVTSNILKNKLDFHVESEPVRLENIDNLSKLNEVFSGKYNMEVELSGRALEDKIDNIYNKMVALTNPVYNEKGEVFHREKKISIGSFVLDFSNVAQSQWKDLIRTELLNKQDTSGEKIKNVIVSFFNNGSNHVSKKRSMTVQEFNSYFDTSEQIFSYADIERLSKVLNWDKNVQLMTLRDAVREGIIKTLDPNIFGDYNPIVVIRSRFKEDDTDYMKIELVEVSRRSLLSQEQGSQQDNIIGRIVGGKNAKRNGVTLTNSFLSRNTVLLNLLSNIIARNNNVIIEDSLLLQVTPFAKNEEERIVPVEIDNVVAKEQLRNMLKFEVIANGLSNEFRSHFIADNEKNNQYNYVRFLINFYRTGGGVGDSFELQRDYLINDLSSYFKNQGQSIYDKKLMIKRISHRLAYLQRHSGALLQTSEGIAEYKYLLSTLKSLTLLDGFSHHLNIKKDLDVLSSKISIISSLPHEDMQKVQEIVIKTSRNVVRNMQEFNKQFDKKVYDVYYKQYSANANFFVNENFSMYKNAYATIEDIDGVRRNAGHLLWTTDAQQDPLFAEQAAERLRNGEITLEVLNANKWVVEQITERYIDSLMHKHINTVGSLYNKDHGRTLTRKDFERILLTATTYNKGMLPIMPKPTSEYVYSGDMGDAVKRQFQVVEREDDFSEILANIHETNDDNIIGELSDIFLEQIALRSTSADNKSFLGSKDFLNKIGLEVVTINGVDKIRTVDVDAVKNNQFSMDLQKTVKTFKLMNVRKQLYEQDALPLLNGIYFDLNLKKQLKGADVDNVISTIKDYIMSAVLQEKKHLKGNEKLEKVITATGKLVTARVMFMNLSIAQVSAFTNFNNALIESLSSDLTGHYQFGVKELALASSLFFSDYGKIVELAGKFQVVNLSEMEVISHFFTGYKGNKQLLSEFFKSLPNWATDFYARTVIMTAQMLKDGTYDAYTWHDDGTLRYNAADDKRYESGDEESAARMEYVKADHIINDVGLNSDGTLKEAYTVQEMANLKWLSDKYIIGAFDNVEKALVGITVLGKQFSTFRTWMLAKAGVVYKKASFQNMGGRLVMIKNEDGRYVGQWERRQIEGFVNTWGRFVGTALNISMKNPLYWSTMTKDESMNLARGGIAVTLFALVTMLANAIMDEDENPYDLIDSKTKDKRYVPGIRFYKNFQYSISSLIMVEDIYKFIKNPFVAFNIINNFMYTFTGEFDAKRLYKGVQVWDGTDVAIELMRAMIVGTEQMSINTQEEIKKKRKEQREARKEKKRKQLEEERYD